MRPKRSVNLISIAQVQRRARKLGIQTTKTSLLFALRKAPLDWWAQRIVVGKNKKSFLREDKLLDFLKLAPKRGIRPKDYLTMDELLKKLQEKGIKSSVPGIKNRFGKWLKDPQKFEEKVRGFAVDRYDKRHRAFFSPQNIQAIVSWARLIKEAPQLERVGMITPLKRLADELGVGLSSIHKIPGIQKMIIGRRAYVTKKVADHVRNYIEEGSHRGRKRKEK